MAVRKKKMKRSAEYHIRRWYGEKSRVVEDGYRLLSLIICLPLFRPQCLIIYRSKKPTSLSTTYPNYLSTSLYCSTSLPHLKTTPQKSGEKGMEKRDGEKKRWSRVRVMARMSGSVDEGVSARRERKNRWTLPERY